MWGGIFAEGEGRENVQQRRTQKVFGRRCREKKSLADNIRRTEYTSV